MIACLIRGMVVPADQIEQREQENPDDVDEVPVQAGHFDRRVVVGVEAAAPRP